MGVISELLKCSNSDGWYLLMNKDRPIFKFRFITYDSIQVVDIFEKPPFWISDLQEWLSARGVAKHRNDVRAILKKYDALSIRGFVLLTRCVSLVDTLWVKRENENVKWSDISPYTNSFVDTLGSVIASDMIEPTCPSLSTDGEFPKCWKKRGSQQFLIKEGRTGYEPFAEVFASSLRLPNANVVRYSIEKGRVLYNSVCECFTSESVSFVPYALFGKWVDLQSVSDYYESIGCLNAFNDMLLLDAVSVNTDRHAGNFGILVDADTYEVLSMAPVFDMNYSYGCASLYSMKLPTEEYIASNESRRFGDFIKATNGRVTEESLSSIENSLLSLSQRGIPYCEEDVFERMLNISRYQIDRIKQSLH